MLLLALVPYCVILLGLFLGYAGVRPAMLGWAICMLGALSGPTIGALVFWQSQLWMLAGIASLPFIVVAAKTIEDLSYPLINDVTTDVAHPPVFAAAVDAPANAGRDLAFPDRFGPIIRKSYPDLRPIVLDGSPPKVFRRAFDLVDERVGWDIKHSDEATGIIEAEVTTAVLSFVDDVVIRVKSAGDKTRVDMRSKSREGLVDGGCNAEQIRAFLNRLEGRKLDWSMDLNTGKEPPALKVHRGSHNQRDCN